jgi:hypothetical protein
MVRGGSRRGPALIRRGCCKCAMPGRLLRCWRLACGSNNHSVSGNWNGAIAMQTSSRRMVRFDMQASTQRQQQDPETRTTVGQRSIRLREGEGSPRNVARSGMGGLSISVWGALPL